MGEEFQRIVAQVRSVVVKQAFEMGYEAGWNTCLDKCLLLVRHAEFGKLVKEMESLRKKSV